MNGCAPIEANVAGGLGDTGWIVTPTDFLTVTGASNQVGESLTVNMRFVLEDLVKLDQISLSLSAGDRSIQSVQYDFTKLFDDLGNRAYAKQVYLSDVSIEAAVATTRGQTFARVNLFRFGTSINQNVKPVAKCAILSDYVTQQVTACLRNARHFTSIEGPGWVHQITVANPLPGAEWKITVPANARWLLKYTGSQLACSAAAANRVPGVGIFGVLTHGYVSGPGLFATANNSPFINSAPGANTSDPGQVFMAIPLPADLKMLAGEAIGSVTANIQAGDQYQFITIDVEEWIDNA